MKIDIVRMGVCSASIIGPMVGCIQQDEQMQLGQTENAVILDSYTPTWAARCEGYTSGGGQRVRGHVRLSNVSLGNGLIRHSVDVMAENWKKNFGWNLKNTLQLRIEGTIYLETSAGADYMPVYFDTGGELATKIGGTVIHIDDYSTYAYVSASLNFYGRDGTHCNL